MKKLLIILLCLFPFISNATMVTDFTAETSPASTDLLWLTIDPSTTAADRKITLGNLLLWMATQDITLTGTIDASGATITFPTSITVDVTGDLTGNADTATTLAANGANCSSNQAPLGVDASGAVESCFAVVTVGADNNFTGSNTLSKVNSAGGSADVLTLSGTLGIMDATGTDIFRGIYLNYTNANHTGGTFYGIQIANITGDAEASETAIQIGSGWDEGLASYSPILGLGNGSTTKGLIHLYDLDNSAYVGITPADETTSYTLILPGAKPAADGLPITCNSSDSTCSFATGFSSITIGGFTASRNVEADGSGNLVSSDTATTGTGAPVKATSPTLVTPLLGTPTSGTLTNCTGLPASALVASTSQAVGFGTVELGHASDTTLSRVAAGIAAVEGIVVGGAQTPVIGDADVFDDNCTGACLYGGTFIVSAAGTVILPNATVYMNFTILLEDAVATVIEPLATGTDDTIVLNGTALTQGHNITSSTKGAMCVFQYRAADSWMATCNGFVDGT